MFKICNGSHFFGGVWGLCPSCTGSLGWLGVPRFPDANRGGGVVGGFGAVSPGEDRGYGEGNVVLSHTGIYRYYASP